MAFSGANDALRLPRKTKHSSTRPPDSTISAAAFLYRSSAWRGCVASQHPYPRESRRLLAAYPRSAETVAILFADRPLAPALQRSSCLVLLGCACDTFRTSK